MKKIISVLLIIMLVAGTLIACTNQNAQDDDGNATGIKETDGDEVGGQIPEINVAWGQDLHTANPQISFEAPELFEDKSAYLKPISDSRLELIKDGDVIANINFILGGNGSENVTLMSQGHLDVAYSSSTAFMTGIDQGLDCSILWKGNPFLDKITPNKNIPSKYCLSC